MTNGTFEFSSQPVALIFANIKTVRDIRKVLDDEGVKEIKGFLKYLQNNIRDLVPELQSWKDPEIEENGVYIHPSAHWEVLADDYIAIGIEFRDGIDPSDVEGNPWVGLWVPEEWGQKKIFKEKLLDALPKGFIDDWSKPENEWPIWTCVNYEDYSDGNSFDTKKFVDDILRLVGKIIKIKDTIDNTIKQVQSDRNK